MRTFFYHNYTRGWIGYRFIHEVFLGRFKVQSSMREAKNFMDRFGGGWKYKLGVCVGSRTVIFDLVVMSIRIDYLDKDTLAGYVEHRDRERRDQQTDNG
jgi:hypothetical protein